MNDLQYISSNIRSSAILTTSYVESSIIWLAAFNSLQTLNQLVLLVDFTIGSLTSMELKIEYSDDGITYFQQTFIDLSWWTASATLWEYTFTATWKYEIATPIKAKYIKVSVKWTWTVTSSLCFIKAIVWTV